MSAFGGKADIRRPGDNGFPDGGVAIATLSSAAALGSRAASGVRLKWEKTDGDNALRPQRSDLPETVRAVGGFLDRAARHCAEIGTDPDDFVQVRLFEDMAPFHFQIRREGFG
jgi:hypothetical protein